MGIISSLFSDPRATIIVLLLALPGRLLAISAHESAHGLMAERCGDPTARMLGRITLNPLKHFDLLGFIMMMFVGIGWAKPVPINPRNYKHARWDDLKVSLAGIVMNLILCLASAVVLYGMTAWAVSKIPYYSNLVSAYASGSEQYLAMYEGKIAYLWNEGGVRYYVGLDTILANPVGYAEFFIKPALGTTLFYLYQMIGYSMLTNLLLAVFNLLPVPPLDGYHVVNDLILRKQLFADRNATMISTVLMYGLFFSGYLSKGLTYVEQFVVGGLGSLAQWIYQLTGLL